jgi:deoxyadenosine/deoxycytidine kinase
VTESQILASTLPSVATMIVVFIGILINNSRLTDLSVRITDLRAYVDTRFTDLDRRITELDRKMDQRFNDAKDTWRAELHRVEEVLDARLKHLEER